MIHFPLQLHFSSSDVCSKFSRTDNGLLKTNNFFYAFSRCSMVSSRPQRTVKYASRKLFLAQLLQEEVKMALPSGKYLISSCACQKCQPCYLSLCVIASCQFWKMLQYRCKSKLKNNNTHAEKCRAVSASCLTSVSLKA